MDFFTGGCISVDYAWSLDHCQKRWFKVKRPGRTVHFILIAKFILIVKLFNFSNIMANSTGSLELQGLEQTVFPEHMEHPMPSTAQTNQLEEKGQNKRKVNKPDSRATKRSKKNDTQRIDGSPDYAGANNEQSPLPAPPHISLRDLMEAETKLVFGDEQDITHKSLASTATQLMCQAAEIGGPPSGPNLSFLPQTDKWLDVALQDANSYYQQKKYATAASRFTAALELCSKGAVFEKPFNANYEDICKVASFIESRIVTCYLRKKWPNPALLHSHRSIQLNPICFQNHLGQAMVYGLLGNPYDKNVTVLHLYPDPRGGHLLPQTTNWSQRSKDGDFLHKLLHKRYLEMIYEMQGKKILPVLDFIKSTKLSVGFSIGSGHIERLQYASVQGQLNRFKEHTHVLHYTLAELVVAPYLQDISPSDTELLRQLLFPLPITLLKNYRWRKQAAGMRLCGDPWSVHALKNMRTKRNQRIINILYGIQIGLNWEFSLNAH
uniref:Spermatogenesis associated 16 n=1 Tax=Cyprinus carpio TaxID=7962 RepID=A0A8C2HGU9_CYPCA